MHLLRENAALLLRRIHSSHVPIFNAPRMQNSIKPILFILALITPHSSAAADPQPAPTARPNILFLIADDLATRLGCYGDSAAITPNLDRLAQSGVVFNRAYCQGAVCTPSRTSFMLGLNTRHAKTTHFIEHPETMTMGRWFREHGYQTAAIGKIDHDDPNDAYTDPKAWDLRVRREEMAPKKRLERSSLDEDLGLKRKNISFIGAADSPDAVEDSIRVDRAIKFFDSERDHTKPFFTAVGFHAPHVPWNAMKEDLARHDPAKFTLEPTPMDATPLPAGSVLQEPGITLSEQRQREGMRGYYAAVTFLDRQIGRLLDHLRSQGALENTLVIFTSDHGYHLGWRGQWCKHSIDEQVMRVPLIASLPKQVAGVKANGIVELIDLFPTFCEFSGLSVPDSLDGKSFLSLIQNPNATGKPAAFCRWGNGRTVRTHDWRLTERNDGTRELYDHSKEHSEYYNVIATESHGPVVNQLHELLEAEFGPMQLSGPVRRAKKETHSK